ncbi:MAG TPA: hypothetical protein VFK68_09800, partial [Propionibacteriaceae bacterium]|nr:hypothetical protein [Propionibacteriaceae bacterium]
EPAADQASTPAETVAADAEAVEPAASVEGEPGTTAAEVTETMPGTSGDVATETEPGTTTGAKSATASEHTGHVETPVSTDRHEETSS